MCSCSCHNVRSLIIHMAAHSACCPRNSTTAGLLSAARCFIGDIGQCEHNATAHKMVQLVGIECIAADGPLRGFFLVSHTASSRQPCTAGDTYRFMITNPSGSAPTRFSAYAKSVPGWPSLYYANATAGIQIPGLHRVTVTLLETQDRALQLSEGHQGLRFTSKEASPTRDWFRYRICTGQSLKVGRSGGKSSRRSGSSGSGSDGVSSSETGASRQHSHVHEDDGSLAVMVQLPLHDKSLPLEPRCRSLPPTIGTVSVALDGKSHFACGRYCTGNASARIITPYRGPKDSDRLRLGFHHIIKPEGCRFHWFDEEDLGRCLAGRTVLNIGGSVANGLQRGFERISSNAMHKAKWWWDYGRTGISNNHDEATGISVFKTRKDPKAPQSVITTQFIHHPFRHGLTNVLAPDPKAAVAFKTRAAFEKSLCKYDLVIFESGVHDMASPDRRVHAKMHGICAEPRPPCTDEQLMPVVKNQSWRLDLLGSYRRHLEELMGVWTKCKAERARRQPPPTLPWRAIFKLSYVPNANAERASCTAEWGYNTMGHYMMAANAAAREVVEAHGFEVFDPTQALVHAEPQWYDLNGRDALHSDALSDLITQTLINQLCEDDTALDAKRKSSDAIGL